MAQTQQKTNQPSNKKSPLEGFLKPINEFLDKLTKKEKIAYGLIILGAICIIIGIILW